MDLLKIALRLAPWCAPDDVADALACALEARALDVAASPYDARAFGLAPVRVETDQGRAEYRARQAALMARVRPVRERLLRRYDAFLAAAFGSERVAAARRAPADERYASARPGGPPWRQSLTSRPAAAASEATGTGPPRP